jgi:putative ABC transport system substrate-binding protein
MNMNRRRKFLIALGASALVAPSMPFAQQQRVYRIGYLANDPDQSGPTFQAFLDGLRDLKWIERKNIEILYKTSYGRDERFAELAAEVVRDNVDLIFTTNTGSTKAAIAATNRIPIVFGSTADPVEQKFVASLAHPGGNVTGLAILVRELGPKRLEWLKLILPRATRVARLYQGGAPTAPTRDDNAQALGVSLKDFAPKSVDQIEASITSAAREKFDAMTVQSDGMLVINRDKIAALAIKFRLPIMCGDGRFTEAGALVSYGENYPERYRRAAYYVDKILRGAKPANLPIEQPMKIELVINLKTAQVLGITIPSEVLSLADRVIK